MNRPVFGLVAAFVMPMLSLTLVGAPARGAMSEEARSAELYGRLKMIFGKSLGQKVEGKEPGFIGDYFTPPKQFRQFTKYSYSVTPLTHRICGILAEMPNSSIEEYYIVNAAIEKKFKCKLDGTPGSARVSASGTSKDGRTRAIFVKFDPKSKSLEISLDDIEGIQLQLREKEKFDRNHANKEAEKSLDAL